jgi:general secretion pathway protein B
MSYILDALRKADAQRERDPARGIHAQPVRLAIGERRLRNGNRIALWAGAAGGIASLAVVGWYLYRDGAAEPVAPSQVAIAAPAPGAGTIAPAAMSPPPPPPAAAVMPPPVVTAPAIAVAPPVVRAAPQVAAPQVAAAPVSAPPVTAAPAVAAPAVAAPVAAALPGDPNAEEAPRSSRRSRRAALASVPGAAPAPAAAPTAAPAAQPPVAEPVAGLPADAPKLVISGGVYSGNVAQRMLIVNGQVFNEGSEVGAGIVLEQIRPKAAVLKFRGSRYTVTY